MSGLRRPRPDFSRRGLITAGTLAVGGVALSGCDKLSQDPKFLGVLDHAESLTLHAQRLFQAGRPLAREFSPKDISPTFKANGSVMPSDDDYQAALHNGFKDWALQVDGLVERPLNLSLAQLKAMPSRTQITRHDCVEGWSAIAGWTGVPLGRVLRAAGLKSNARYVVFHCADDLEPSLDGTGRYYESLDLVDAFHPQTILAYAMNGRTLGVPHGAPIRLRVERQLGYKQAKYVMRLELVDRFDKISGGKGGFWEDRGYEWYAGI
ncbi:MAG TPA: molybdopterin-binding protein [Caulobacteraceae bacterium]|jgi:DMSO/TMAO reductase YedYZ molybdopterin-dependent catalytic subunit|nr:molybdopterin-binding protein [Caulobacteraceae bacterium]